MKLHLSLPYPPSVNHYWRHSGGRHYIDKPGRSYRTEVWAQVLRQRDVSRVRSVMTGPLSIDIAAGPPDLKYRDLDNILKALLDSLKHAQVYEDDYQIIKLECGWLPPRKDDARVWVAIEQVETPGWWQERAYATARRRRLPSRSTSA
jgi:crossover junction endodeoxyribonuclease RusA